VNEPVLVVHSNSWLGIARLPTVLAAAGAAVTVMAPRTSSLLATRCALRAIPVPDDLEGIADALEAHLREHTYRWVIIADDPLLDVLAARSATQAWARAVLPVPNERTIAMLGSKIAFLAAAREAGLPIAASETVTSEALAARAASRIGYPVMLKASAGSGGSGVKRLDTPAELRAAFAGATETEAMTVERFVAGTVCGCEVLFNAGRPVCWSPFAKYRMHPALGPSSVRKLYADSRLHDLVWRIGALTGFHGFATFCFIHDTASDELVLLEVNFRPGTGMHLRGRIRRMFAAGVATLLNGGVYTGPQTPGEHGRTLALFPQDVFRAIERRDPWALVIAIAARRLLADVPFNDGGLLRIQLRELFEECPRWFRSLVYGAAGRR